MRFGSSGLEVACRVVGVGFKVVFARGLESPLDELIQAGKSKSDEIGTEAKLDEIYGQK